MSTKRDTEKSDMAIKGVQRPTKTRTSQSWEPNLEAFRVTRRAQRPREEGDEVVAEASHLAKWMKELTIQITA